MEEYILIVEDDNDINQMLRDLLTAHQYEVKQAFSGTEALMLIEQQQPQAVILDLMLPGMNGEELLIHIKEHYIHVDKSAFIRIIENLMKNALVHGKGGYKMSLTREEKRLVVSVSNLTESIEQNDMEYIFDRFYTSDQSRSRKTTGLGLSIVKRFAKEMGGEAEASLEEQCFTVKVYIPVSE